jgi:cytidine deaminase
MPCGRCRQVLIEHGGPELLIAKPGGVVSLGELLPQAFGLKDLAAVAAEAKEQNR